MKRVRERRPEKFPMVPLLSIVLVLAILIGGVVVVMKITHEKKKEGENEPILYSGASSSPSSRDDSSSGMDKDEPISEPEGLSQGPSEPKEDPVPGEVVEETAKVDMSYFDDAVFIGDSITTGLDLYDVIPNAGYLADNGVNPVGAAGDATVPTTGGGKTTIIEGLKEKKPKKVYILLGSNGIMWMSKETIVASYGNLLDQIREVLPEAILYVQSITPVTAHMEEENDAISNEKIDAYNLAIQQMAKDKKAYYLDICSALRDETGKLPTDASPKDGMHFSKATYDKWLDYLKSHAVQ